MTFTYDNGVPAAPDNPSTDQPVMLTNAMSLASIWEVDHVGFNASSGGTHEQVTYSSKNTPSAQTDPQSVTYTASGVASSVSQNMFACQNGTFQLSAIRAWGYSTSAGIVASQSINVTSVVRNSAGTYTITLATNAVSSANFAVFSSAAVTASVGAVLISYAITGTGTFQLVFRGLQNLPTQTPTDPTSFTFMVLQI